MVGWLLCRLTAKLTEERRGGDGRELTPLFERVQRAKHGVWRRRQKTCGVSVECMHTCLGCPSFFPSFPSFLPHSTHPHTTHTNTIYPWRTEKQKEGASKRAARHSVSLLGTGTQSGTTIRAGLLLVKGEIGELEKMKGFRDRDGAAASATAFYPPDRTDIQSRFGSLGVNPFHHPRLSCGCNVCDLVDVTAWWTASAYLFVRLTTTTGQKSSQSLICTTSPPTHPPFPPHHSTRHTRQKAAPRSH